jgi:membrane fusion protein, macrolide-specific efflux system
MTKNRNSGRTLRRVAGVALLLTAAGAALWWTQRPRVDYATAAVGRHDVEVNVTAIGTLQPRKYVDVGAQVSGQITRLHVEPGSEVVRGQLLVEIDPSVQQATVDAGRAALAGLAAQLADQRAQHVLATHRLARQRQMARDGATRDEDVQTAEAMLASAAAKMDLLEAQRAQTQATQRAEEARLGYTRIYAPMDGTVIGVRAREGQTLNATYQTPDILRIADLSAMTVWTDVSEADVGRVRPGMPVHFTTLGGHGQGAARRWDGTVRQVLPAPPVTEAGTGTAASAAATKAVVYTVLFDVDNADGALMPQMTAQVVFVTGRAVAAIAVPLAAITTDADTGGATARVLGADGRVQTRTLSLGLRSRHLAEVTGGLREGERLVTGETAAGGGPSWLKW